MVKSVLYIGNHLSRNGGYPSVAETLRPLLKKDVELRLVSNRKNKLLRIIEMLFAVVMNGREGQPVIIDTYSTQNFYYAYLIGLCCQILKIKYACVLHGGNLPSRLNNSPKLCKTLFSKASYIVSPSGYLHDEFKKKGYDSRIIPNFIPIEKYAFKFRKTLEPRLLWVRAFDATYNPQMALMALKQLRDVFPKATLCMVGPDKDGSRIECERLATSLGINENVKFTGRLPKEDWVSLSQNYDLFINTTNIDNTPVSVIEAMSLGLPVVSTNVGGIPYLIENKETGLLIEPGDTDSLVQSVKLLINDSNLAAKMSVQGRKKVEQFSWDNVRPLWLSVFNSLR